MVPEYVIGAVTVTCQGCQAKVFGIVLFRCNSLLTLLVLRTYYPGNNGNQYLGNRPQLLQFIHLTLYRCDTTVHLTGEIFRFEASDGD